MAAYEVRQVESIEIEALARRVLTAPAPSRGGRIVADILGMLGAASSPHRTTKRGRSRSRTAPGARAADRHDARSVIDARGTAAALSSTLGSGSGVFRSGAQLNNMLGELDVIGNVPRAPGTRLPTMLAPTLVLEDDRPRLVLGSAGSVRLAGAIAQVAWRVLTGSPVAEAIDAPRIHVDGSTLHLEGGWATTRP